MKKQAIWNNILDMISQSKKDVKIFDGDAHWNLNSKEYF